MPSGLSTPSSPPSISSTRSDRGLRSFGQEAMSGLCSRSDYERKLEEDMREGQYALLRAVDDIFFDPMCPENGTIRKRRLKDPVLEIHQGGRWEKRLMKDVFTRLMRIVERYYARYFKKVRDIYEFSELSDHAVHKRTKVVRDFGSLMYYFDWRCEDLSMAGVSLTYPDFPAENARQDALKRAMGRLILDHVYDRCAQRNSNA